MSLFCLNVCKFGNCALQFETLYELIAHIEEAHISRDPETLRRQEESQPTALPLSYVLPLFPADRAPQRRPVPLSPDPSRLLAPAPAPKPSPRHRSHHSPLPPPALPHHLATASPSLKKERDDEPPLEDSSNDGDDSRDSSAPERKFRCPHPGCHKKYKNMNGMRQHQRTAHSQAALGAGGSAGAASPSVPPPRLYKCPHCPREYKTQLGLHNHVSTHNAKPVAPPPPPSADAAAQASAAALGGHQYHQALAPGPSPSYAYPRSSQQVPKAPPATAEPTEARAPSPALPAKVPRPAPAIHAPNPHPDHNF